MYKKFTFNLSLRESRDKLQIKYLFVFLGFLFINKPIYAQTGFLEAADDQCCGGIFDGEAYEQNETFCHSTAIEDNDPLETINRGMFWLNLGIDMVVIEPIAAMYVDLIPKCIRDRIGNVLQNLSEPIVLTNNLLQGDLEEARITLGRFYFNTLFGVAGIFDVATDRGLPYRRTDLGLTFASWGVQSGPYLVLPVLGPSNARDAWGRIGDFSADPINWLAYPVHSNSRTGAQVLDAKTDNIEFLDKLKEHSLDYYATIRTWYSERRKDLIAGERQAVDTPRPDEEDES